MGKTKTLVHSIEELEALMSEMPDVDYPNEMRIVPFAESKRLTHFILDFEPYTGIAKRCGMNHFSICRSQLRFYLSHVNDGGHVPRFGVLPVTFDDLCDTAHMEDLRRDWGYAMVLMESPKANWEF